jgi:hypothetical protein
VLLSGIIITYIGNYFKLFYDIPLEDEFRKELGMYIKKFCFLTRRIGNCIISGREKLRKRGVHLQHRQRRLSTG